MELFLPFISPKSKMSIKDPPLYCQATLFAFILLGTFLMMSTNLHQASLKKLPPFLLFMFDKFVNCLVAFVSRDISVCDVVWTSVDKADCLEFCQSEKSIWPHTQNLFLLCHFLSTWEIQRKALFLCWQLQH